MKYIQTLLLLASFAGILYCVRMLRALHTKVSTSNSKITNALNEQKKLNFHAYRQSEAFQQLIAILKFTAPIPPTRGWVASPDLLLTMTDIIRTHKPRLVVELGSGVSTLVIAKAGAKKVISIDNSEEFAAKTKGALIGVAVLVGLVLGGPFGALLMGLLAFIGTKVADKVRYDLAGGDLMDTWSKQHLKGERDLIQNRKEGRKQADDISSTTGERKNSFLKKHRKKSSWLPSFKFNTNSEKNSVSSIKLTGLFEQVNRIKKLML